MRFYSVSIGCNLNRILTLWKTQNQSLANWTLAIRKFRYNGLVRYQLTLNRAFTNGFYAHKTVRVSSRCQFGDSAGDSSWFPSSQRAKNGETVIQLSNRIDFDDDRYSIFFSSSLNQAEYRTRTAGRIHLRDRGLSRTRGFDTEMVATTVCAHLTSSSCFASEKNVHYNCDRVPTRTKCSPRVTGTYAYLR